ncbi:hypothetical protein C4573_04190 [Candidatus Woesearchaeota archaeon]|nr:MAG: hypothetical protein C4573_04190 [Candidatus Woesearchaeota archaeon]
MKTVFLFFCMLLLITACVPLEPVPQDTNESEQNSQDNQSSDAIEDIFADTDTPPPVMPS